MKIKIFYVFQNIEFLIFFLISEDFGEAKISISDRHIWRIYYYLKKKNQILIRIKKKNKHEQKPRQDTFILC